MRGPRRVEAQATHERVNLLLTIGAVAVTGFGLAVVAGGPRLPAAAPSYDEVRAILGGSTLPLTALPGILLDAAWLLWAWITLSLVFELLVLGVEAVARGAAWVAHVRHVVDRLSFPLARRVVTAAFAVQVLSRGVSVAAAQPLSAAEIAMMSTPMPPADIARHEMADDVDTARTYVVRSGDTLWSIAEREYGSGAAYRCLVHANVGRRMADGDVFTARGVIRPGWDLVVPPVDDLIEKVDGQRWYTVRSGDTLTGIAALVLGDDSAWRALFDVNAGARSPEGQHALTDPNVIWPGLRLRLPDSPVDADATGPDAATDALDVSGVVMAVAGTPVVPDPPAAAVDPPVGIADASPQESADTSEVESGDPSETPIAPPLVRTQHALYPVALDPADTVVPTDDSSNSNTDAPSLSTASSTDFPVVPVALGGAGLVGAAGLAIGARRLRRLRRLPQESESEVVVEGGFAEAQLTSELARGGAATVDPVQAIVARAQQLLTEYNLGASVVTVRHGNSSTTLAYAATLSEQQLLVDLSSEFSDRLGADVEAWVSNDQDVHLKLTKQRVLRLLSGAERAAREQVCLIPVGVLYDRQTLYAACDRLGHVLIASLPGHGADTILTSLVATMTARRSPQELQVWIIASSRNLPAPIFEFPHAARVVDPADQPAMQRCVDDLRLELDRRAEGSPSRDLVVVVSELTELANHALAFELLAARAATTRLGVSIIAATINPEAALQSPLQSHFTTRMILRMQDEETSVGLLGVADAAFLGGGGRMLVRLEEREAVEVYGFHVSTEHLERLLRVMRSAYAPAPAPSESHRAAEVVPSEATDARALEHEQPVATDSTRETLVETRLDAPAEDVRSATVDGTEVAARIRAPIEVICFDGPRVECRDQVVWPRPQAKGGDAKPWEFLLFLACQPSEGIPADKAGEAFWPDHEDVDVAHRVRQLRYRLRRMLAVVEGAPSTDGISLDRGVLRLDPGIVHSDAQEFLDLVREARIHPGPRVVEQLERARSLFSGDLLSGPDAHRYTWLEERSVDGVALREHFRRQFLNASAQLADAYAETGKFDMAIDVLHELTEIEPAASDYWSALYRLHAQCGDRLGLLREERRYRAVLHDLAAEMGRAGDPSLEEPDPKIVQEFQRLLATLRDSEPETAAV